MSRITAKYRGGVASKYIKTEYDWKIVGITLLSLSYFSLPA